MSLDSDATNADAQLHVEFYEYEKDPYKGQPFVRIVVPGDKTNIIEQPAREHHKARFPRQWFHYQSQNNSDQVVGISLALWNKDRPDELTDGQMIELGILKFQTVEQVARASDAQLQRVGMGAVGIRERARSYLASQNAAQSGAELELLKAQVAQLTAMLGGAAKHHAEGAGPVPDKVKASLPPGMKRGRFGRPVPIETKAA